MNKTTRIVGAALAVGAFISLSACGSESTAAQGTTRVALVLGRSTDPYFITEACGAKERAKELNVDLAVDGPKDYDPVQQTTVLNALLAKKPKALIITPTDRKVLVAPLQQAKNNGIKIIETDSFTDGDLADAKIGADGAAGGKLQAQTYAQLVGEKGKVLMIGLTPGIQTLDDREAAFQKEIEANHPGITYVGRQYSGDSPDKVASIINATLAAHPDLNGVVSSALLPSEAAAATIKALGKSGQIKVLGFDTTPTEVERLRDGSMSALIAQTPREYGRLGVEQAVALATGKKVENRTETQWKVVTKDNVDSAEMKDAMDLPNC